MKAMLLAGERFHLNEVTFVEVRIWQVPVPLSGSAHSFKYSLALVANGVCVLRYDNEAGKGDHKHRGDRQVAYRFRDLDRLRQDFMRDVEKWRRECGP
jgi:hypothetical protein